MYIISLIKICVGYTVFMYNTVWVLLSCVPASRMLQKLTEQINLKLVPAHSTLPSPVDTILRGSFYGYYMYFCCIFSPCLLHTSKQYIKKSVWRPSNVIDANRKCVSLSINEAVEELKHIDKGTSLKLLCKNMMVYPPSIWRNKKNCWNCRVIVMNKCQLGKQSIFLWAK